MRLLHVARDISLFLSAAGPDEARAVIERRAGAAYDPRLAELAMRNFDDLLAGLDETRMWEQRARERAVSADLCIAGDRIDAAFAAIAAITGLKSPWLREHSTGVAELAEAAAWRMGLPADSVTLVRRAALAHDLGRVGVSNAIWEKPGPLGFGEWERVRLHPHFTERAFAQSPALAPIGLLAGSHHERLDGSGYHRGTRGPALDQAARILAAADCYAAMREARPYRPALDAPAAEAELLREAEEGRLDPEAVDAVLAPPATGCGSDLASCPPALTERELEVLLVLVRGASNQADRRRISASRPRPSGTTSSTSTRRPASAAGPRRRSGPSSTTSFARGIGHSPDAARAAGADTRLTIGVEQRRREPQRRTQMILATTTVEDFDRFTEHLLDEGRREAQGARVEGCARSFATPIRTTGSGCSSTGTRRAGRASSPTPRSRRS